MSILNLLLLVGLFSFQVTAYTRPKDNYCTNGPNSYFCSESCNAYYYCNGQSRGALLQCPAGTTCNKLGPHKKYANTDDPDGSSPFNMYDSWDVTYACEKSQTATCWNNRAKGKCEFNGGLDQTCAGGGNCRSTSPDCVANAASRSCFFDTPQPETCQCTTTQGNTPTTFDPTYSTNMTAKQKEGVSCTIINPGIRAQCDPPMDVIFVNDASNSITGDTTPVCYDNNQIISCATQPRPANMITVYDEYAKARYVVNYGTELCAA